MKAPLCMIVDVSGSMNEMGKIHLQRNMCRYATQLRLIDQKKYADLDIRFYQWTQEISEITIQSNGDIPVLNAEGSTNLCALSNFLSQHLKHTEKARVLILSDGNFNRDDFETFKAWKKENIQSMIRTVAVGTDADLPKLKEISTNNDVHLSENISSAIDSTIFGSDKLFAEPVSTAQILQPRPIELEELKED